ncbi:hypothetical protein HanHA89_Chr12g0476151 [Helianthus annuus]|nr:hypothetical protein HanHA89_Chr12g0476151 [Helianthus annuus]
MDESGIRKKKKTEGMLEIVASRTATSQPPNLRIRDLQQSKNYRAEGLIA